MHMKVCIYSEGTVQILVDTSSVGTKTMNIHSVVQFVVYQWMYTHYCIECYLFLCASFGLYDEPSSSFLLLENSRMYCPRSLKSSSLVGVMIMASAQIENVFCVPNRN